MEVFKFLMQTGVAPYELDDEFISIMIKKHHNLGCSIKREQEALCQRQWNKKVSEEMNTLTVIQDSTLISALEAYNEINCIKRTIEKGKQPHSQVH